MWDETRFLKEQLDTALRTYRENGLKAVESEKQYRIKKAEEILRLKNEGYPTTLILDIVKGLPEVAELDARRNADQVVYKANGEAIQVKKLELRTIQSQLEKEFVNVE